TRVYIGPPVRPGAGPAPVLASSVPLAARRHLPALVHHLLHQLHHPHHLHHVLHLPTPSLRRASLPPPASAHHPPHHPHPLLAHAALVHHLLHQLHHPHHLHHVLHLPALAHRHLALPAPAHRHLLHHLQHLLHGVLQLRHLHHGQPFRRNLTQLLSLFIREQLACLLACRPIELLQLLPLLLIEAQFLGAAQNRGRTIEDDAQASRTRHREALSPAVGLFGRLIFLLLLRLRGLLRGRGGPRGVHDRQRGEDRDDEKREVPRPGVKLLQERPQTVGAVRHGPRLFLPWRCRRLRLQIGDRLRHGSLSFPMAGASPPFRRPPPARRCWMRGTALTYSASCPAPSLWT